LGGEGGFVDLWVDCLLVDHRSLRFVRWGEGVPGVDAEL